jgi:hypothetical protein
MWALAYSTDIQELDNLMCNLFSIIKLQDIATFISHLSFNPLIKDKIIDWIFTNVKTNLNISYKNFAHIIERLTPNIYNLKLIDKLKVRYNEERDPIIFAIELDKLEWHVQIVNAIFKYKN